jgi:hypothetical protein
MLISRIVMLFAVLVGACSGPNSNTTYKRSLESNEDSGITLAAASCQAISIDSTKPYCGYEVYGSYSELGSADAGSCEKLTPVPCGVCATGELSSQMNRVVDSCGGVRAESTLGIVFSNGCPVRLYGWLSGPGANESWECITRALEGTRYACAEEIPCWTYSDSTIVPSTL